MTWKKITLSIIGALLVIIGSAAVWQLGPALFPPKSIEAGITLNTKAPVDMPLRNSAGQPTSLAQIMGEKGAVLVLVRSADWCPFCKSQLIRTNEIEADVAGRGYALASLSYDAPEILAAFAETKELNYTMLSDEGSKMIDALGLRDPQYDADSFAYGVPRATILILANDGTVKAKYVAEDFRSRPSNDDVLSMLNRVAD